MLDIMRTKDHESHKWPFLHKLNPNLGPWNSIVFTGKLCLYIDSPHLFAPIPYSIQLLSTVLIFCCLFFSFLPTDNRLAL